MLNKLRLGSLLRHDGLLDLAVLLLDAHHKVLCEPSRAHLVKMVEGATPIPTPLETGKVPM